MPDNLKLKNQDLLTKTYNYSIQFTHWLESSSFYPLGFKKEKIIETEKYWIVLGKEIVYKFLKLNHLPQRTIKSVTLRELFHYRWKAACEEILDSSFLADKAYLGLRLLRWHENRPEWISEKTAFDLDPQKPPQEADDVVIVMRRINKDESLDFLLEEQRTISRKTIFNLAEKIYAFQRAEINKKLYRSFSHFSSYKQSLENNYLGSLEAFILREGSYLDQFSQTALREIKAYLQYFLQNKEDFLISRLKQGSIIDCHSTLSLKHISRITALASGDEERDFVIWGRPRRNQNIRMNDLLMDWASLISDLEARGFKVIAKEFEDYLAFRFREHFNSNLLTFYKIAEAAKRACLGFSEQDMVIMQSTNNLSLAFNYALGIKLPYLLVLDSNNLEQTMTLARSIKELSLSSIISYEQFRTTNFTLENVHDLLLEKALSALESKILLGHSVVLLWPLNRDEECLKISTLAENLKVPYRFINFVSEQNEVSINHNQKAIRKVIPLRNNFSVKALSHSIPQYFLDSTINNSEQALQVLRSLR